MSKASKRRLCPAAGHEITPAECGEGRGSRFACPPDCGFSLLAPANYSQLLELERELDGLALDRLKEDSPDPSALTREFQRAVRSKSQHDLHALIVWRFLYQTDASGRTCAQRWEQAGFPGLKNDGRVLMRAKMGLRVVLLETYRVLDAEQIEVVDLLDAQPRPFIIRDRSLASITVRFAVGLGWAYPLPHYQRMFGSAILLQDIPSFEPQEVILEIVRHLGGPTEEWPLRRWLAEHFTRVSDAITAVGLERRRMMFASIDAKYGKAVYELKQPFAACCKVLDDEPNVDLDDLSEGERREGFADARVWFVGDENPELAQGPTPTGEAVLGKVLLGQAHWRVEAMGAERLAVLRRRFEKSLGDRVRFTGERLDELAQTLALKDPKPDLSLVPPRLVEAPNKILLSTARVPMPVTRKSQSEMERDTRVAMDREFLDHPVPALDGRTPREAARDPALRPKLIRLMKERVRSCDERNLETGGDDDVNWMLRELGLDEILFDPPPPGRQPRSFAAGDSFGEPAEDEDNDDASDTDDVDAAEARPMDPALPRAPRLPDHPFTAEEVEKRVRAALDACASVREALDAMGTEGCTLLSDMGEVSEEFVDNDSFGLLVSSLLQIWRVFVPAGTRGFNVPRSVLGKAIVREVAAMTQALKPSTPAAFDRYLNSGAQPALAQLLFAQVMSLSETMPKKSRPTPEQLAILGAVQRAAIEELDRANRRP